VVVHGGAWLLPDAKTEPALEGVQQAARRAWARLRDGAEALDGVEVAVRSMEDNPAFNAGHGACLNSCGKHELDAMIMEGKDLQLGAVAGLTASLHPVSVARTVIARSCHSFLAGAGADAFALEQGCEGATQEELSTASAHANLAEAKARVAAAEDGARDTVGAVCLDSHGTVACATSTGGMVNKLPGRVGDSPVAGSGGYADNRTGAVSTTGHGEMIMRVCLATRTLGHVEGGEHPFRAASRALAYMVERVKGVGGMVLVTADGSWAAACSTPRMAWAAIDATGTLFSGVVGAASDPGEDIPPPEITVTGGCDAEVTVIPSSLANNGPVEGSVDQEGFRRLC
jgi:L-asparaginase / beta-aspartyl-peptidase